MKIGPMTRSRNNLLRIIPANVTTNQGLQTFNGLLDDGSTISFIDADLRNQIVGARSTPIDLGVSGLNGTNQEIRSEEIVLSLYNQEGKKFEIEAIVIQKINENITLPDYDYLRTKFPELNSIKFPELADKPVQMLIGQNAPYLLTALKADLFLGEGHPNVRFTHFGPALGYTKPNTNVFMSYVPSLMNKIIPQFKTECSYQLQFEPNISCGHTMAPHESENIKPNLDQKETLQEEEIIYPVSCGHTMAPHETVIPLPIDKHDFFSLNEEDDHDPQMEILIQKLINDEDTTLLDPNKRLQTPQNEELELKIRREFKKSKDGHMEIPIFWKTPQFELKPNYKECYSFDLAQRRKIQNSNPEHWNHCIEEIQKQVKYGAARIVEEDEDKNDGFYHPMVVVIKQTKTSTPIRMCLDASRKFRQPDGKKKCFNDQIPTGTNILNDLQDVLTHFRTKRVTLFCDLTKMFFNVWIAEHQRKYARFIFDSVVYESRGYPFGLRISPYVTCLGLKLCAEEALKNGEISKSTFDYIDKHLYMDDGIFALDSDEEAIDLAHQLMKVFDSVHMRFTKIGSNSKKVLKAIPEDRRLSEINFMDPIPEAGTLGLRYDAEHDTFCLSPVEELASKVTKSEIMRIAAKVYDPNNYLALITIKARKLTQLIFQIPKPNNKEIPWKQDLEQYRESCPDLIDEITKGYYEFGKELMTIGQIKIPRLISPGKSIKTTHLIVFGDGSGVAYGACAYLRSTYEDKTVTVRLVKAAKKCTPVRKQTIPRIELMAALESAKLSARLTKIIQPTFITLFTDALVVLFWIKKSNIHRFDDWTQVRLTRIHELTKNGNWRHVESSQNPADLLSRGVKIKEVYHEDKFTEKGLFWMEGPKFLQSDPSDWPRHEREIQQIMTSEEKSAIKDSLKTFQSIMVTPNSKAISNQNIPKQLQLTCLEKEHCSSYPRSCLNIFRQGEKILDILKVSQVRWNPDQLAALKKAQHIYPLINYDRYGSIHKAARITKIVKIACNKFLSKIQSNDRHYQDSNLKNCYKDVIIRIQAEGFRKEFNQASKKLMWPVNSSLNSINALFDEEGILRANSKLADCLGLMDNEKKPILIPSNHPFLPIIIKTYHLNIGHGGSVSELMAGLRLLFFFPRMRQVIKKFLNKCVPCKRKHGRPFQPHMGNTPVDLQKIQIFEHVSLDFFGPVKVYQGYGTRGRTPVNKFYVLVIVCLQIHAIHLEMCEKMDTDHVLSALQRLVCRKRMPTRIRSDNFGSFDSTKEAMAVGDLDFNEIKNALKYPVWENPPPASPDQNLAETFVRLVKKRLDLDLKDRTFHRDQLSTLLMLAEDSVNNRPLTFLSDDVNDPIPITANRLLKPAFYSDSGIHIKEKTPQKYRQYYEEICELADRSFKKWVEEFTIAYQKYPKWKSWRKNVKEGDLVIVIDNDPFKKKKDWGLGIVTRVYPSDRDQIVRKCLVRYRTSEEKTLGTYLRHTRNLIPLGLWHQLNENEDSKNLSQVPSDT